MVSHSSHFGWATSPRTPLYHNPWTWPAIAGMAILGAIGITAAGLLPGTSAKAESPTAPVTTNTKTDFLQAPTPQVSALTLGQSVTTNYATYCQPEYPPVEKPACLLGLGDKLPDGNDLGTVPEVPDTPDAQSVPESPRLLDPIPYQYDKTRLFPLP